MNALRLPDPIAAYFSDDARGAAAVAHCFTTDAVVQDEGRTYRGLSAIEAWKAAASAAYAYTSEPMAVETAGDAYIVTSRVVGNFPGSPVNLRYRFRLADERIASLEITT